MFFQHLSLPMNSIIKAFIYSNFWVALCYAVLTYGTLSYYELPNLLTYTCINFFSVLSAYQFHRLYSKKKKSQSVTEREIWIYSFKKANFVLALFTFSILLIFITTTIWTTITLTIFTILNLIVIFYVVPFPVLRKPLRAVPYLKNKLISITWTSLLVVPFLNENKHIPLLFFIFIGLQTTAQLILFDSRDVIRDDPSLKTIPQMIGINKSKLVVCCLVFIGYSLMTIETGFHPIFLVVIISNLLGLFIKQNQYDSLLAEFVWDLPFFLIGISFYFM